MILIDVRSPAEFAGGALEGALNVPLSELQSQISSVAADKQALIVLYCASGGRSGMGCALLQQMGYPNVTNAGGLFAAAAQLNIRICT